MRHKVSALQCRTTTVRVLPTDNLEKISSTPAPCNESAPEKLLHFGQRCNTKETPVFYCMLTMTTIYAQVSKLVLVELQIGKTEN
jgi:hypothetical protein